MLALHIFEFLFGCISCYVGVRIIKAKEIPIVSEGGSEPLGWLRGSEAVAVGVVAVCFGIAFFAAALDLIRFG
jgi:hypothetical protein